MNETSISHFECIIKEVKKTKTYGYVTLPQSWVGDNVIIQDLINNGLITDIITVKADGNSGRIYLPLDWSNQKVRAYRVS